MNTDILNFINSINDELKKQDSLALISIMSEISGEVATLYPENQIGFGIYNYEYASGFKGSSYRIGFAPRKDKFSLYLSCHSEREEELLQKLGKYKKAVSCIYFKRLADLDLDILKQMIQESFDLIADTNPK